MYCIVEFLTGHFVECVPSNWLMANEFCAWPPYKNEKLVRSIRSRESPADDWDRLKIRILFRGASFEETRKRLSRATYESDLQSSDVNYDSKRTQSKRNRASVSLSSSSSSCEENDSAKLNSPVVMLELPSPPKVVTTPHLSSSSTSNNCRIYPQDAKLYAKVEQLHTDMQIIKSTLARIELLLLNNASNPSDVRNCSDSSQNSEFRQPLQTMQDVDILEKKLLNEEFSSIMERRLSYMVGRNAADATRRMLASLMENDLAKQFNFSGRWGKRSFRSLLLRSLIIKSLKKCESYGSEKDEVIDGYISSWLHDARDRDGGRKERLPNSHTLISTPTSEKR